MKFFNIILLLVVLFSSVGAFETESGRVFEDGVIEADGIDIPGEISPDGNPPDSVTYMDIGEEATTRQIYH